MAAMVQSNTNPFLPHDHPYCDLSLELITGSLEPYPGIQDTFIPIRPPYTPLTPSQPNEIPSGNSFNSCGDSSVMGSPSFPPNVHHTPQGPWSEAPPQIITDSYISNISIGLGLDSMLPNQDFVDPALVFDNSASTHNIQAFPGGISSFYPPQNFPPPSPAPSDVSSHSPYSVNQPRYRSTTASPRPGRANWSPYPMFPSQQRRSSTASSNSKISQHSPRSSSLGDEDVRDRGYCPFPDCGKMYKDLKAHFLTHQPERPEKCPIVTCDYHIKGFARKYDKNRHTLTHYKGTMVCGFCPGSGSAAEKSFNRADVFKRHLMSVHGVEQCAPNARKKCPTTSSRGVEQPKTDDESKTGKCSTCSTMFNSAQEFYEHLDDCVLKTLEQPEASEAINQHHLIETANDNAVQETLERHLLTTDLSFPTQDATNFDEEEYEEDEEDDSDEIWTSDGLNGRSGKGTIKSNRKSSH